MAANDPGLGAGSGVHRRVFAKVAVFGVLTALASWGVLPRHRFMAPAAADECRECGGDGQVEASCVRCFGRGYYRGANCAECNHTGKVTQTCRFCGGSGKKPK